MKRCIVGIRRPDAPKVAATGRDVPMVRFPSMSTLATEFLVVLNDPARS